MQIEDMIKAKANALGLDAVGITTARPLGLQELDLFNQWLVSGGAQVLPFMSHKPEARLDPTRLLPTARSVVVAGLAFKPATLSCPPLDRPYGQVALYAVYRDYHTVLRKALAQLASFIDDVTGQRHSFRIAVDSSPIMERALAVRAGLGLICTNHMLAHPVLGPAMFLAELITDLDLTSDGPMSGRCLQCMCCVHACPTGALHQDGFMDVTKCLNTWTIEHKGEIPQALATKIGKRVYGCDACITACPLYLQASPASSSLLEFHPEWAWLDLEWILAMSESEFARYFAGSPIRRIGLAQLKRNAKICTANR